jgi:MoaA/NifB/PqqE/SkfB family radical SAM enzyme
MVSQICATATLRHLARRRLLDNAITFADLDSTTAKPLLRKLVASTEGISTGELEPTLVSALFKHLLVQPFLPDRKPTGLPFGFVKVINFELTYGCNLACSHCLQDALRPKGKFNWIPADAVIRALHDAKWLGLTALAVNFTGGETFTPGSPIMELIAVARDIGTTVRANTNAWWGGQTNIKIGDRVFASDQEVINALSDRKLRRLALSLDNRYDQYPNLLDRVIRVATLCENAELSYEFVVTDPRPKIVVDAIRKLVAALGGSPNFMNITPMDTVDIGGAALKNESLLEPKSLDRLAKTSPCATMGFHRPNYLHVAPDGGVRSCLYAPGAGWHGNIINQRLPQILNDASENPIYLLFKSKNLADFVDKYIVPWQHFYKEINHGCAASAFIARIAEEIYRREKIHSRPLTDDEMEELHKKIGRDYHLSALTLTPLNIS